MRNNSVFFCRLKQAGFVTILSARVTGIKIPRHGQRMQTNPIDGRVLVGN
jgi:hypothetical protein